MMTVSVDATVLLYASDRSSRFHERAVDLVERLAAGPQLVYLFWPVIMSYLRISTHPGVFRTPLSPDESIDNVDHLLSLRHVRAPGEDDGFWSQYRSFNEGDTLRGNLVPDAHVVALMHQFGVATIFSHDRDYRRFDGIRVEDPFTPT